MIKAFVVAASQELVDVTLVGDVEDEAVFRRFEDQMHRERELDHTEIRAEVTAIGRSHPDQCIPNLVTQLIALLRRNFF